MQKAGQVTIFIIVAIVILVGIVLFFLIKTQILPGAGGGQEINPNSYFESCMEDRVREGIETISMHGGSIENKLSKSFQFEDENRPTNISYLCYNQNNYLPCINQEPMLISHIKSELEAYLKEDVRTCFDDLTGNLQKRGYVVEATYRNFTIDLSSGKVILVLNASITLTKSGQTTNQNNFRVVFMSKFYDLAVLAQEIASQEAKYCNFENLGYMLLYPSFEIDKFRTGDSTTIYTLADRDSLERFRFAIRSCVIPPGF